MSEEIVFKKGKDDYGVKDIRTLEGIEAIRLRPGMFVGSITQDGLQQITLEIISNAVDEYMNGFCTRCSIIVDNNNKVTVIDDGRGVPFGKAADGSETLENIFTKLHTGAKFDASGKTGYNTSGGLNGVGSKATNALSKQFIVTSCRDGKQARMTFEKGKRIDYKIDNSDKHGTTVEFLPDEEIFKEGITLDFDRLNRQVKELAYLSPGMVFELSYKDKEKIVYSYSNGIKDYMTELIKGKNPLTSMFYTETIEDRIGVKIAMQYIDTYSDTYKLFTNNIPNTSGTHLTGFRTALTSMLNDYARDNKLLKEKDENITGEELKEGLVLILSFIMPDPVFSGQTKEVLSSTEGRQIVQRFVSQELKEWFTAHPKDVKAIVEKALLARLAREKAKKAKEAVRNTEKKGKSNLLNLPTKLVDAWSNNRSECELLISEGDSAAGGLIGARDSKTQAIFPVRGKLLNLFKSEDSKTFANQEIVNIIKALGLTLDPKTKKLIYESSKMRYGKVIMCADAE